MKLKPRKIAEAVAEKILMASGYLTSIVIVLIVVFLFREGAGLFDSPAVEQGYVLAVNRANPVQSLTPEQIMQIFDADLTNWSEVGGPDDSILVFRLDDITSYATEQELGADLSRAPQCLSRIVADHPNMIAYLPEQYVAPDFAGKVLGEGRITPASFFAGRQWYPTAAPAPQYGLIPLLAGTLWVSLAAILIALPLGLSVAIYMAELADSRLRRMLKRRIPIPQIYQGADYRLWIDRYYIAAQRLADESVRYVYLTRIHIRSELLANRNSILKNGFALLDSEALVEFAAARRAMERYQTDYALRLSSPTEGSRARLNLDAAWSCA